MLLIPFFVLTTLGLGLWLLGHFFGFTGVASIGAVLVIAIGGAVVATGLSVRTGETVTKTYANESGSIVNNETTVSYSYDKTSLLTEFGGEAGPLSMGGLQMLAGALLMVQHLNRRST
jgi:hypothetical protein